LDLHTQPSHRDASREHQNEHRAKPELKPAATGLGSVSHAGIIRFVRLLSEEQSESQSNTSQALSSDAAEWVSALSDGVLPSEISDQLDSNHSIICGAAAKTNSRQSTELDEGS
jgi:hypothetical protein